MRVVVDTNVLVSGVFWAGSPHRLLQQRQVGAFELVVSPDIVTEYLRVLDEMGMDDEGLRGWRDLILSGALVVEPEERARVVLEDPDDDKFLSAAASACAEYVVSGDKRLLSLHMFRGVRILTPAAFLRLLP